MDERAMAFCDRSGTLEELEWRTRCGCRSLTQPMKGRSVQCTPFAVHSPTSVLVGENASIMTW